MHRQKQTTPVSYSVNALSELTVAELARRLSAWGISDTHARRLLRTFYRTNELVQASDAARFPAVLLERVRSELPLRSTTLATRQVASDGTTKILLRLADGHTVESVLMPDFRPDRSAGCLSSQVGCAMSCDFCATAQGGFQRNLTSGEIVEQFLNLRGEAKSIGRELRTIVFMGMGEPLLNLDHLLPAIERIGANDLGGLGWRQITVSTVGIVPGIDALTATGWNLHLAVSIHAPDDSTRARLLPSGRRYGLDEILAAADRFQVRRGRPVILQYCLLAGVNDAPGQAQQLADLVGRRRMHVNLLRYNPTGMGLRGSAYQPSTDQAATHFAGVLKDRGVVAHFRRSRGPDIDAACGQLRQRFATAPG
ncbi:MAG: 23S rRNA (adenine(2503)-C(2))-methyltransferase RlmN [Verrucomicrobiales bacterium]|nr:23S rRNA (adenine(2503)-C(2))-methyltransferase RlmN [Verrucomicrobiales bacterium]